MVFSRRMMQDGLENEIEIFYSASFYFRFHYSTERSRIRLYLQNWWSASKGIQSCVSGTIYGWHLVRMIWLLSSFSSHDIGSLLWLLQCIMEHNQTKSCKPRWWRRVPHNSIEIPHASTVSCIFDEGGESCWLGLGTTPSWCSVDEAGTTEKG